MRLLVVADDFPLPANSGGRIDIWRRLLALREAGVELALLAWYDAGREGVPAAALMKQLGAVVATHHLLPIRRSGPELLGRAAWLGRLPSHAAARWVTVDRDALLAWASDFAPDALLLDRLYGVAALRWLADALQRPWAYRSHNREAAYMKGQLARAQSWRSRVGLALNQLGLERLERQTLQAAGAVLDISQHDAAHWRAEGVADPLWLPPAVDAGFVQALAAAQADTPCWDALYFGNLNTPNNLEALAWWVEQVLPRLPDPALKLAVAGSRPSPQALALVRRDPRIELVADPPQMAPLLAQSRVLLNPMRSGSGVNLKSVEMLYTQAQLLSTSVGLQGLPESVTGCFSRADEPGAFAQAMQSAWAAGAPTAAQQRERAEARACFEPAWHARRVLDGLAQAGKGKG